MAVGINRNFDYVRITADRTVFHIALLLSRRQIDRDNDVFTATVANVAGFVVHYREGLMRCGTNGADGINADGPCENGRGAIGCGEIGRGT